MQTNNPALILHVVGSIVVLFILFCAILLCYHRNLKLKSKVCSERDSSPSDLKCEQSSLSLGLVKTNQLTGKASPASPGLTGENINPEEALSALKQVLQGYVSENKYLEAETIFNDVARS